VQAGGDKGEGANNRIPPVVYKNKGVVKDGDRLISDFMGFVPCGHMLVDPEGGWHEYPPRYSENILQTYDVIERLGAYRLYVLPTEDCVDVWWMSGGANEQLIDRFSGDGAMYCAVVSAIYFLKNNGLDDERVER